MLRVFEAATDQSPMAGAGHRGQGNGQVAATTDAHIVDQQSAADMAMDDNHGGGHGNGSLMDAHDDMAVDHHPYSPPLHQQQHQHHNNHHHGGGMGMVGDDDDDTVYDDHSSSLLRHHQMMGDPARDDTQPLNEPLLQADT
jgi:hypothetical protein